MRQGNRPAGDHWLFDLFGNVKAVRIALALPRLEHRAADYLHLTRDPREKAIVEREFHKVQIGPREVGLRYENGVLVEVLAPNTRALYWKGYLDIRVENVSVETSFAIPEKLAKEVLGAKLKMPGADLVHVVQVPQYSQAVLTVDGKVEALLPAGVHAFWRVGRDLRSETVESRLQMLDVAGQEILTRDKVALRVNLVAGYRITDVLAAYAKQAKPVDYLYKELQFGLRAAVGTRTLDELRLKELETLEKVTEKIDKISVFSGLEGLMKDLVKMRP